MRSIRDIFRSYAVLDAEGRHIGGTDKESNHHYGDAYEQLFTWQTPKDDPTGLVKLQYPYSWRNDVKLMMEVGVADGSSILAWMEIFPNATCVAMDIHEAHRLRGVDEKRVEFHLGNQCSKHDCERAAAGRYFDVIVDDATHELDSTLLTLLYLWPHVKAGGLYIIEEFSDILALRNNVVALWPFVEIVDTIGEFGGTEPLVVLRKSR